MNNWNKNKRPKLLDKFEGDKDKGIKGFKKVLNSRALPSHPSELLRFKANEFINWLFPLKRLSKKGDIGFSVTRGGEIAGEHTVSFISENDRIDLTHKANNRSIFVNGAIEAAIFLSKKKKGFFEIGDLLNK